MSKPEAWNKIRVEIFRRSDKALKALRARVKAGAGKYKQPPTNPPTAPTVTVVGIAGSLPEEADVTKVFSYKRNYSMMETFEPFRQFKDGAWHDYALISTMYTRFEVVDLESGKIIAVEEYPKITQAYYDKLSPESKAKGGWAAKLKVGQEQPGSGFYPVDFYVPDLTEVAALSYYDPEDFEENGALYRQGNYAFYSGCHWGDDSSWKLRYIDLTRISEGIVTSDSRFGYVELMNDLRESVTVEDWGVKIAVSISANMEIGKLDSSDRDSLNWTEK